MDPSELEKQKQHEEEQEEEEEEEDEDVLSFFSSMQELETTRQQALTLYNQQQYEAALPLQYKMARYVNKVNRSATHPENGIYFLDYGLTQLRLLQIAHEALTDFLNVQIVDDDDNNKNENKKKSLAALQQQQKEEDEEAMETCFVNLEVARVAIQKKEETVEQAFHQAEKNKNKNQEEYEKLKKEFIQISNLHADVHDALALLFMEKDDYNTALEELETELLLYRNLQDLFPEEENKNNENENNAAAVAPGKVVSVLYQIANCFIKEGDFKGGEAKLRDTLAEIEKINNKTNNNNENNKIPQTFIQELQEVLEDAVEMNKNDTFEKIKKEINDQYCADQMEKIPSAEEFYSHSSQNNNKNEDNNNNNKEEKKKTNPFVSAVPGNHNDNDDNNHHNKSNSNSCLSMPISGTGEVLGGIDFASHNNQNNNNNNIKNHPLMKEVSNLNSNSQSLSVFPPQHLLHSNTNSSSFHFVKEHQNQNNNNNNSESNNKDNENSNVVHTVVARKKPKQQQQHNNNQNEDQNENAAKKVRHE